MNAILNKHVAGELDEQLSDIRLKKNRLSAFDWDGRLISGTCGRVSIQMRTEGRFRSLFLNGKAGVIVPEDEYFSLDAVTNSELRLHIPRMYPRDCSERPLSGIDVVFQPDELVLEAETPTESQVPALRGFINAFRDKGACCFSSLIDSKTPLGSEARQNTWFIFQHDNKEFALGRERDGVRELAVWGSNLDHAELENAAKTFLYALGLYVGERLEWLGCIHIVGSRGRCVLRQPVPKRRSLQHRIRPNTISESEEREFLARAFDYFERSSNLRVVNQLAMLWDSTDNFFPIQALVATTVVEGIADHIVSDDIADEMRSIIKLVKRSCRKLISKNWTTLTGELDSTLANAFSRRISESISSARRFSAKELVREAAAKVDATISRDELDSWSSLRNPRAHGNFGSAKPDLTEVQVDSHALDCAFNITYKLILGAMGYRGCASDFSRPGWPTRVGNAFVADD